MTSRVVQQLIPEEVIAKKERLDRLAWEKQQREERTSDEEAARVNRRPPAAVPVNNGDTGIAGTSQAGALGTGVPAARARDLADGDSPEHSRSCGSHGRR